MRWSSSARISALVASFFSCSRGFCRRARASSGTSSSRSSSRSYVASKFVFSLDGRKTGSISLRSSASKSMHWKNMLEVNESNPAAPMRRFRSRSSSELMACRHGCDTGGLVSGKGGSARLILDESWSWFEPSNGRYNSRLENGHRHNRLRRITLL